MPTDPIKHLLAYCEAVATNAQTMADVYERLGLTENVHRHHGVIAAMTFIKAEINRIVLLQQMEATQ